MNENRGSEQQVDLALYEKNRQRMSDELLDPFAGQWVAISGDGTKVLASGPDLETAETNLAARGVPGNSVVWERIPALAEDTWL